MSDMKGDYAIIDSVPLYNPMKSMMVTGASFLTFILLFFFSKSNERVVIEGGIRRNELSETKQLTLARE